MLLQRRIYQLVLLSLIPVLGLEIYGGIADYRQRTREVHNQARLISKSAAQDIGATIEAARLAMVSVGQIASGQGIAGCGNFLKAFKQQYAGITGFGVLDADGVMQCSTIPSANGQNFSAWPPFQEAKRGGSFVVANYSMGRDSGIAVLPMVLPLDDGAGKFIGAVSTSLDLNWVGSHITAQALPVQAALGLIDRSGVIALRVPPNPEYVGKPVSDEFQSIVAARHSGTMEADARGILRIVGYAPVGDASYGLVVSFGIDKNKALAGVRWSALLNVAVILVALALSLLAARIGGQRFVRQPLSELARVIDRWHAGDMSARAENSTENSEIGRLSLSFNDLADRLSARTDELNRSVTQQRDLIRELNHRVKNTLAIVQAIAAQSFVRGKPAEDIKDVFNNRLVALAQTHNMLSNVDWSGIDLRELADVITAPYRTDGKDPFTISGPKIVLSPSIAVTVALVVHELCTNALKHGALTAEKGRVSLKWFVENQRLNLSWQEYGGPEVVPPVRTSFGARFIRAALQHDDGSVSLEFRPGGVVFQVTSPLVNWTSEGMDKAA